MPSRPDVRPDDHRRAAAIATEAGELLVGLRSALADPAMDPATLRAEADRSSHELIVATLAGVCRIAFLLAGGRFDRRPALVEQSDDAQLAA